MSALRARFLGADGGAAFGAELASLRFRAALAADGAGDLLDVALFGPVDGARLLLDLFARGRGLCGGHLLIEVGRAVLAEAGLLVPADRFTDPVAAAVALLEGRGDFRHRVLERRVVRGTADGALHFVGAVGD